MADIPVEAAHPDLRAYGNGQWSPYWLRGSDVEAFRSKDGALTDARNLSRTSAFAKSAARTVVDNVVGSCFRLTVKPDTTLLGVTPDQAEAWSVVVKAEWDSYAEGLGTGADAARGQSFSGLMRTAFMSYFVSGEALGSVEWKANPFNPYRTCLLLIDPERLSDPLGVIDYTGKRRIGVEIDDHGAATGYWLRRAMPSDALWDSRKQYKWDRYPRYTGWGRPRIIHAFERDRPHMTRGISAFTTASDSIRRHSQYVNTELEAAATRAIFAATLTSELDYESAIQLIGPEHRQALQGNGPLSLALQYMTDRLAFYGNADQRIGNTKVMHLLPGEKLDTKSGSQLPGMMKEFSDTALYEIASALGVDAANLTKNYSNTNYSGARVSLAEIERSYSVRRCDFTEQFAIPFAMAWLEECIVVRGTIPMLGGGSFYDRRGALGLGFSALGRISIDPLKEIQAQQTAYQTGASTLKAICDAADMDWRDVLTQRAAEKAVMNELGLKPEDINPELAGQMAKTTKPDTSGSNN